MKRLLPVLLMLALVPSPGLGAIDLVRDRLSFDALGSFSGAWTQFRTAGVSDGRGDFFHPAALVGLLAHVSPVVGLRVSTDVAAVTQQLTQEFYLETKWSSGIVVRAGQVVVPLGREALTPQQNRRFADYSIVSRWWKPGATYDVGVLAGYEGRLLGAAAALVNGNDGRTYADDNKWKDVCARVALNQFGGGWPGVAARVYYGKTDVGTPFLSLAGEAWYERENLEVLGEAQHAVKGIYERNCFVVQAAYRPVSLLEPVLRLQIEFQKDDRYDYSAVGGLNVHLWGDAMLLMLEFEQMRKESNTPSAAFSQQRVLAKLQAWI